MRLCHYVERIVRFIVPVADVGDFPKEPGTQTVLCQSPRMNCRTLMKLIIGGAHHGKLDYARKHGDSTSSVYQCVETEGQIDFSREMINSLHLTILAQIRNGDDSLAYFENNLERLKSKTILCDDISCGVVPVDKELRMWRETVGRVLVLLSTHSEEVVRVYYGLGTKIK